MKRKSAAWGRQWSRLTVSFIADGRQRESSETHHEGHMALAHSRIGTDCQRSLRPLCVNPASAIRQNERQR